MGPVLVGASVGRMEELVESSGTTRLSTSQIYCARGCWQRCLTRYPVRLKGTSPATFWPWIKSMLDSDVDHRDTDAVHAEFDRVRDAVVDELPIGAGDVDATGRDPLALISFLKEVRRGICFKNP